MLLFLPAKTWAAGRLSPENCGLLHWAMNGKPRKRALKIVFISTGTKRRSRWALSNPTPQARHNALGIALIFAILPILVSRQINFFRQWRPVTHPGVDPLRFSIAGQRLKPGGVVAIHDSWLVVEVRRDGLGEWAVLPRVTCFWNGGSPCVEFGVK